MGSESHIDGLEEEIFNVIISKYQELLQLLYLTAVNVFSLIAAVLFMKKFMKFLPVKVKGICPVEFRKLQTAQSCLTRK